MYDLHFYTTNDGSIGLYDTDTDDIYHSVTGASTEALLKFVLPANIPYFISKNKDIKVLDICYGIGYNSKSLLNFILQNRIKNKKIKRNNFLKFTKNKNKQNKILSIHSGAIHSDNISNKKYSGTIHDDNNINANYNVTIYDDKILTGNPSKKYNVPIYGNNYNQINNACALDYDNNFENYKGKIYITAIEKDFVTALISPLVSSKKTMKNKNYDFINNKIEKYRTTDIKKYIKISKEFIECPTSINLLLFNCIVNYYNTYKRQITSILYDKKYIRYFDPYICRLFRFLTNKTVLHNPTINLSGFLHNIYYKYLSIRHKNELKALKTLNINFNLKINDARMALQEDNSMYNIAFLDAFTPSKAPELWTIDFFNELYKHLEEDGVILTYSSAAPVRNAFICAGFTIGKIYNPIDNSYFGTVAAKNKNLIINKLSDYEYKILTTKSGIPYRDRNLSATRSDILANREKEVRMSNLKTLSSLKKHNIIKN